LVLQHEHLFGFSPRCAVTRMEEEVGSLFRTMMLELHLTAAGTTFS
jgi:hypothetical protein